MKWLDRILGLEPETNEPPRGDALRVAEVSSILERLAPVLAADGGEVRLVAVEGDDVVLAWRGACRSCSSRSDTLQLGIEPRLRAELGWVRNVRAAT